jgi:hypothetical protein
MRFKKGVSLLMNKPLLFGVFHLLRRPWLQKKGIRKGAFCLPRSAANSMRRKPFLFLRLNDLRRGQRFATGDTAAFLFTGRFSVPWAYVMCIRRPPFPYKALVWTGGYGLWTSLSLCVSMSGSVSSSVSNVTQRALQLKDSYHWKRVGSRFHVEFRGCSVRGTAGATTLHQDCRVQYRVVFCLFLVDICASPGPLLATE